MKRMLSVALALCLVAPGPALASTAVKTISFKGLNAAAVVPGALTLPPAPAGLTTSEYQDAVAPTAVAPGAAFSPLKAETATSATVPAPLAQDTIRATAQEVLAHPENAQVALDATFDAAKSAPKALDVSSVFASPSGASREPNGLTKPTPKAEKKAKAEGSVRLSPLRLVKNGFVSAFVLLAGTVLPAVANGQTFFIPDGQSYQPPDFSQTPAASTGSDLFGLWLTLGILGTASLIYLANRVYQRRQTKKMLDSAEPDSHRDIDLAGENQPYSKGEIIDVDPVSGAPIRMPAPAGEKSAPQKVREPGKIYFEDVAGQNEAKAELEGVVDYLKNPAAYTALNPRYKGPKGVLLFGPPGTGKTLLARAAANEAGVPFVHRAGSDFINTYVGKGADNIREAFNEVRKQIKTKGGVGILFIDEIEAIGGARTGNSDRSEETRTINALLKEMDGFEKDNIIVIAATNMPESLDPALLRGGRFGTKIPIGLPDVVGREAVLRLHTKEAKLGVDVDLKALAKQTPGLAGADLEQIVMDATKLAKARGAASIGQEDFVAAVDEFTTGRKRRLVMSESDKRTVAYHEAGHAVMSHLLPDADPVRKVTIIPHGLNALGFMQAMPEEEKVLYSYEWLVDRIAVALGGRVAEKMMTGRIYSGAQNDFQQATRLAKLMVMQFGMNDAIGQVSYDMEGAKPAVGGPMSEQTRRRIDAEVKKIIDAAMAKVEFTLQTNRDVVEAMAQELMEKETLRSEDMDRLMKNAKR